MENVKYIGEEVHISLGKTAPCTDLEYRTKMNWMPHIAKRKGKFAAVAATGVLSSCQGYLGQGF